MSVDTIVRHLVVNVGNVDRGDVRRKPIVLYDGCVGSVDTNTVYGLEFPVHKPERSLEAVGREDVGREQDAPAFWPVAPLTEGQDDVTTEGCAVSAGLTVTPDALENYVHLAFVAYHPETPDAGYCVAWLNVNVANAIDPARFQDMNIVDCNAYIPRQSQITLVCLAGITPASAGGTPGYNYSYPGLTINGLTGLFDFEIFA